MVFKRQVARERHLVLVVLGLGDQVGLLKFVTAGWKSRGITPIIYPMGWYDGEGFKDKLEKLLAKVDSLQNNADRISLVGASAGASVVLNVFLERKMAIYKAVNVCGRLRPGTNLGIRGFDARTKSSRSFRESVVLFSEKESQLNAADRKKILCIYPLLGDELVPRDTCVLEGANNISVPMGEHVFSIGFAMAFGYVTKFLNQGLTGDRL